MIRALRVVLRHGGEGIACLRRFAAVPENGFGQVSGASVMEKEAVPTHGLGQAYAPKRGRAPFAATGLADLLAVGEAFAHVVQEEVGIGPMS